MIIKRLYYGRHAISSIYVNGEIVWRSGVDVHGTHDVYLRVVSDEDARLLAIAITELMSGDYNLVLDDIVDGGMPAVNAVSLPRISTDTVTLDTPEYITLVDCNIVEHVGSNAVTVDQSVFYLAATASTATHSEDNVIGMMYLSTGIGADAKILIHLDDLQINFRHELSADATNSRILNYRTKLLFEETETVRGVVGDSRSSPYEASLSVSSDEDLHRTLLNAAVVHKDSALITTDSLQGSYDVSDSVRFYHQSANTAEDSVEGSLELKSIVPGNSYDDDYSETINANATVVETTSQVYDITHPHIETLSGYVGSGDGMSAGMEDHEAVGETDFSSLYFGQIVSAGSTDVVVLDTSIEAHLDDGSDIVVPDYVYPIQNGKNLYIPQIYTAVPNGTNLNFSRNAIT